MIIGNDNSKVNLSIFPTGKNNRHQIIYCLSYHSSLLAIKLNTQVLTDLTFSQWRHKNQMNNHK